MHVPRQGYQALSTHRWVGQGQHATPSNVPKKEHTTAAYAVMWLAGWVFTAYFASELVPVPQGGRMDKHLPSCGKHVGKPPRLMAAS